MWRCLFSGGLWNDVMREKCMPIGSVMDWLRQDLKTIVGGSNILSGLYKFVDVVTSWLS